MIKRKIVFGNYDTAAHGWTLSAWKLAAAAQKTSYVDKPGGDGSWDLSTALTDGIMRYKNRNLTVTLECSEGNRLNREALIREMINALDGMQVNIELPDDTEHYMVGRLQITKDYNDPAHAAVKITATCEPWKYNNAETVVTLTASSVARKATLVNNGRRAVVPVVKVSNSVHIDYGNTSQALSAGTYQLPDILLTPGSHAITYSGAGSLVFTYREAVLE